MRCCLAPVTLAAAPPVAVAGAGAHLHEHQRAVGRAQDQVDLGAALARAAGQPIIALHQPQALLLQVGQRPVLGGVAHGLGGGTRPLGAAPV